MTPQFVDFNADGHIDIFAGTFDGSPHVSLGSARGFLEPTQILDPEGNRVMLTQFWNYDTEKWDDAKATPKGHCTSALAFDWDADGDLDILMGDYSAGTLFRRMNEGTAAEPKFSGQNIPVQVDGKVFALEGGLTSHQLIDWDGDGLKDLICGGYGEAYGDGAGAGIWVCRNTGKPDAPQFAAARNLIPVSKKETPGPTRPDTGLYLDTVDWNGDGLLDFVVGGYSHWTPETRELSPAEKARCEELDALIRQQQDAIQELYAGPSKLPEEEQDEAFQALVESEAYKTVQERTQKAQTELSELRPGPMREAFVWLYLQEE